MPAPRTAVVLDVDVLLQDDEPVLGAVALVVDALRRDAPVGVVSVRPGVAEALSGHALSHVVHHVTDAGSADGGAEAVLRAAVEDLGASAEGTVVLAASEELLDAAERLGLCGHLLGEGGLARTAADVDLGAIGPLAPRVTELDHGVALLDGWSVSVDRHEPDQVVTVGSNLMTGNGALGYRGTAPEWDAAGDVACVVAGTYDCADGTWTELVNAPNALRTRWTWSRTPLQVPHDAELPEGFSQHRRLDLLAGRTVRDLDVPGGVRLTDERFASLTDLGLVLQRQRVTAEVGERLEVRVAVDGDVWDLHGPHLPELHLSADGDDVGDLVVARGRTVQSDVEVVVVQAAVLRRGRLVAARHERTGRCLERVWDVEVTDPDGAVLDLVMSVATSFDHDDPEDVARSAARRAQEEGYASLLARQVDAWQQVWHDCDVDVDGDAVAQAALRFGTYHSIIATPRHDPRLPIGARGLSCQAYQGAAFWDQEVYNLPLLLHNRPHEARNLVLYRHATLDGARRKAARLGYRGAYFAWISGGTGEELCPDFFFRDVLTDRPIRNHFNDWQMHVSPDVALAVRRYVHVTGDTSVLADGAGEVVCEVARFLDSFVWHDHVADTFHTVRLLGPDEYHENVDDNAFTNRQTADALSYACEVWDLLAAEHAGVLDDLRERCGFTDDERERWERLAPRVFQPGPDPGNGVIEQFRGFHELEDVSPDDLAERLLHPDEYWGWPNGIAVHTQVSKQADVVMPWVVRPDRVGSDADPRDSREVVEANVDHYLPRTQHGSSLSYGAYALVLARLGRTQEARDLFGRSATTDLLSRRNAAPGGTFIGGIRTAACGVGWQVVVLGFAGLDVTDDGLALRPQLPEDWERLAFTVVVRGAHLRVVVEGGEVTVQVGADAPGPVTVAVAGDSRDVDPGSTACW